MTVSVFTDTDRKGDSLVALNDTGALPFNVRNKVSSARLSPGTDRTLFFTKPNFTGDALFRTGPFTVGKFSSLGRGGRGGFGNTVASVRLTPFELRFALHVVTDDSGT